MIGIAQRQSRGAVGLSEYIQLPSVAQLKFRCEIQYNVILAVPCALLFGPLLGRVAWPDVPVLLVVETQTRAFCWVLKWLLTVLARVAYIRFEYFVLQSPAILITSAFTRGVDREKPVVVGQYSLVNPAVVSSDTNRLTLF